MNKNDEFFDQKELIGKQLFEKFAANKPEIKPYVFSAPGSSEDIKMLSGSTYIMGEIKVRQDCSVDLSLKYGPFCEFLKWDPIRRKALKIEREKGIKVEIMYFNFLNDGVVVYHLKDIKNVTWSWELLPESNYNKTKIDKYVTKLQNPIEIIKY